MVNSRKSHYRDVPKELICKVGWVAMDLKNVTDDIDEKQHTSYIPRFTDHDCKAGN